MDKHEVRGEKQREQLSDGKVESVPSCCRYHRAGGIARSCMIASPAELRSVVGSTSVKPYTFSHMQLEVLADGEVDVLAVYTP